MPPTLCPTCQSPIPENAPGGFCPVCLLRGADEAPAPGSAAPSVEEIAAAFPQLDGISLIGQGGMGFVYKARQASLDRIIALKILAPELSRDPAFAERFAREARTLGKLHHPGIVTVFEHGQSGGFFYLIMEYVDGVNLRQAMRAGRFSPEQALTIVPGICDALQFAHEQGVWHRDIKPENILLDREGRVKIVDFGIARIVGDPQRDFTLTMTGNALGSAAYMAPEQHEKPHDVDHRADIYSLGVVIYELLTGELPLGRFPAPSQRAAVDARIDEIVFQTLEKERELRQQSATEVRTDIHRAMRPGEPQMARPKDPVAPHKTSTMAKLARGLVLTGPLGFLLLAAIGLDEGFAFALGGVPVLLGLVLGIMAWRDPLGKFVVVISVVLLLLGGFITIFLNQARKASTRRQLSEARAGQEYDFSTPEHAVRSMIGAAKEKDVEAFRRGISKEVLEMGSEEDAPLTEAMSEWGQVSYIGQISEEGDLAEVRLKNTLTNVEFEVPLVREGGKWNVTIPDSDDMDESPRAAMEEILRAAREKDMQALRKRLSRSLLALLATLDDPDSGFDGIDSAQVIGHRLLDPSNAEVTLESSENKVTVRMVLEDGTWKLTEEVVQHR